MKKYLSKKRLYAILISISMLISTIVMIPIPIEHAFAEDLYSAEEPAEYAEPVILPSDTGGEESVIIDTVNDDTAERQGDDPPVLDERQGDDPPVLDERQGDDPPVLDTTYDETTYDNTAYDDTAHTNPDNSDDINDDDVSYTGSNAIDRIYYCEFYGEEACICDICEYCEEECICDICEYCEDKCTCDIINFSMLRGGVLIATQVNGYFYLNNLVNGELTPAQAAFFVGDANAATINAAIKEGTPVIAQISGGILFNDAITVPGGHNITLTSEESENDLPLGMFRNVRHFVINEGATLTLQNVLLRAFETYTPTSITAGNARGGITVNGGTLFIEDGARIVNNYSRGAVHGGGGVTIYKGNVIMNGGTITGNRTATGGTGVHYGGGGVYVGPGTRFTMNGGSIHNNRTTLEGAGVYVAPKGEFIMYGGVITNNLSEGGRGGGIRVLGGTFETKNPDTGGLTEKIIANNEAWNFGGGAFVSEGMDSEGIIVPGVFTVVDGTIITNNTCTNFSTGNPDQYIGGAILLGEGAVLNLYGGEIYGNFAGNSKGITWYDGATINVSGNPKVGRDKNDDYIDRYTTNNNPNQIVNIVGPLGNGASINIREHVKDSASLATGLTVIARMAPGQGNANNHEALRFNYLGTGNPRSEWYVIPRNPGNSPDLVLYQPQESTTFALLRVPDTIHFGKRELLTVNPVGPYGDAPGASNVLSDYLEGADKWSYGFEIANTEHNNWTLTLQTTPFDNNTGIIGANPVAIPRLGDDPTPIELNSDPLIVITRTGVKGESIKWHWTQLDYRIEAQTALNTVVEGDFKSVFTWTLLAAPT